MTTLLNYGNHIRQLFKTVEPRGHVQWDDLFSKIVEEKKKIGDQFSFYQERSSLWPDSRTKTDCMRQAVL